MLIRHDVVAVGARSARAATAMLLAKFGHDAVLLDRAHSVRALARRGSGTSPGRWLYTLPGVADHPFASPEDADPCLARRGPVVTFDGRGNGRSDLRRPGYQRGHRGTPRQARLTGRRT